MLKLKLKLNPNKLKLNKFKSYKNMYTLSPLSGAMLTNNNRVT